MRYAAWSTLLVATLLATAIGTSPAHAELTVAMEVPTAPLRSGLDTAVAAVTVSVDCAQLLARSGATAVNRIVEVDLAVTSAPGVLTGGVTTMAFPSDECLTTPAEDLRKSTNLTISLASNLPALEPHAVNVTASLPAAGAVASESASDGVTVTAAPQPILTVAPETTVRRVGAQPATITVAAVSHGNIAVRGEMRVQPTPASANLTSPGTVTVADIELARAGVPGDRGSTTLTFTPPTGSWRSQVVVVTVTAVGADPEATRGPAMNMTFLFQNDIEEKRSPSLGAALGVLLLACAAAARRPCPGKRAAAATLSTSPQWPKM